MIYVASLSVPVKNAFPDDVMQSSVNRIVQLLNVAPEESTMDAVVFGPKDAVGPKAAQINKALANAHPGICIMYIYNKNNEANKVETENKFQCKKTTAGAIIDFISECLQEHTIHTGKAVVSSEDFQTPGEGSFADDDYFGMESPIPSGYDFDSEQNSPPTGDVYADDSGFTEDLGIGDSDAADTGSDIPVPEVPIPDVSDAVVPEPTLDNTQLAFNTSEQASRSVGVAPIPNEDLFSTLEGPRGIEDVDMVINALKRENVVKHLIQENSEYNGLVQMLDTLDKEIESVWLDTTLTPDQKFDKIKDIGLNRSGYLASCNSITAEHVVNIINRITSAAKRTVDNQMEEYNAAISKIIVNKKSIADTTHIATAIQQRADVQFKLHKLAKTIIDLYKSMDTLVTDEIIELDKKLPSSNEFINEHVKPIGTHIFTPTNTASLVNSLMKALQENRLIASSLEHQVNSFIELLFEMFEKDEEIQDYYRRKTALLSANKIEDIVIVDTVVKECLRLWTGADGSGRSATAITWAGILSHRNNSLLIDLTGKAKFRTYGITPVTLDEFMTNRIEKRFLCVEVDRILNSEELQALVSEIKTRLNYYPYVNIIVDPNDIAGLNQLSVDAKTTYFVCNCTSNSMDVMRRTIAGHTAGNIARRLVMIDPPISPLSIVDSLEIDPTLFATTTIPSIPDIRACALRHDRPYEINTVFKIFEEAFR